jgi:hypothetical protein
LGQPYARRHWDITPVSSGAAKVTIYIQQSDFTHYNTNVHPSFKNACKFNRYNWYE